MNATKEQTLSKSAGFAILLCAFLGWAMAGMQLAMTSLINGPATAQLLEKNSNLDIGNPEEAEQLKRMSSAWFGYVTSAFLLGAAAGGWIFGQLGDRIGRTKAMALSIMTYAVMSFLASSSQSAFVFLILRLGAGLGVGGMWPNGVSLVGEVWAKVRLKIGSFVMESRPLVAGVMGTAANVGILIQGWLARSAFDTTTASEDWRKILVWFGATPLLLGIFCFFLPESPKWLALRDGQDPPEPDPESTEKPAATPAKASLGEIFSGSYVRFTLVGILLATIPLIGGWGSSNWVMKWADKVVAEDKQHAKETGEEPKVDPRLKADLLIARSFTGTISSLLGGLIATLIGRKFCYFLMSLMALAASQLLFWFYVPTDPGFFWWFAALGFFSGVFFGWLPLCLPELFPTRIRSAGAGVSFNFGRILTVATIYITAVLISSYGDNYPIIGRVTSLVYALGIVVILMAPDTSKKRDLDD